MNTPIAESELILNPNGSIYHLNLLPGDLAETIITVGDPERVPMVSRYFDSIEHKAQKREIVTHTGYLNNKRISVISTGMGTGCIDIVLNEIDALFNIDFETRQIKEKLTSLNIIRIGTAGSLQAHIPIDSYVVSNYAIGLDNLLYSYNPHYSPKELKILNAFVNHMSTEERILTPYIKSSASSLTNLFTADFFSGITATCSGFYAPQGRELRGELAIPNFITLLQEFQYEEYCIANFEMETAAIYGLGHILGHQCCSISAIVANRAVQQFSHNPYASVDQLIQLTLEKITATEPLTYSNMQ
ncbi:MAG: Uridine phosphorylase [Legionellaceae bacterium]